VIADSTHEACILDGVEGPVYHQIFEFGFNPDGSKFATIGFDRYEEQFLCVNGVQTAEYSNIALPVFSADGNRVAFRARNATAYPSEFAVIDGKPEKTHARVGLPVVSKDGKHVAYTTEDGPQHCVVLDGVNGPVLGSVGEPILSATGDRIAYSCMSLEAPPGGKMVIHSGVVIDGTQQRDYQRVGDPCFSDDGRHVAYCAMADGHAYLIADGEQSVPFDSWLGTTIYFDQGGAAHCMGVKDGNLVRVSFGGK
jgi:hypothetical protein